MLTREAPDFIATTLWPANSPDNQSGRLPDLGKLQERVYCSQIHDVTHLIEESEHFNLAIN